MMECINCRGKEIVKRGKQVSKSGSKQIYYCKSCNKRFVDSSLKGKHFDSQIILNALSFYNLGNSFEESAKLVNRQFKANISKSTIHNWLAEFKEFCSFYRIREKALSHGGGLVASKLFRHKGLTYNFAYHKAKLDLFGEQNLKNYLKNLNNDFPHEIFERDARCSEIKIKVDILKREKNSYAGRLAEFVLNGISDNSERHSILEKFMLVNDTATLATEVPIWFWEKRLGGICGHIDILQKRFGKIYILDFKPEAASENLLHVSSQLYLYALGLSFRTGIKLNRIRCAWFDADHYFEFEPAKAKVDWSSAKIKIKN